jgi:phenylacetic acid degradation operon negative regulatory protein
MSVLPQRRESASVSQAALAPVLVQIRTEPSRTWSIIITIYGDAIVPRGGSLWLGTLLIFFEALGISGGVVRTAMSRLARDGWLDREKVGRNSFYRLTEKGLDHIYNPQPVPWTGAFDLLLLDNGTARDVARTAMRDAGFGEMAPGAWIAPAGTPPPAFGAPLVLQAAGDDAANRRLASKCWRLEETAEAYRRFVTIFTPLHRAILAGTPLPDIEALIARVLLVHGYRRIILRDPILPLEILPPGWPGTSAKALCAEVYPRLLPGSERWLDTHAVNEHGVAVSVSDEVFQRFNA